MKTGTTVAAFALPVRLRPVDRRSTPCQSPIAPRTSSLAAQTQRRRLRRTRPEQGAGPEPEPTSSGPWQPREPTLPEDRDFGPAMARLTQRQRIFVDVCSAAASRLRRRVEPATAIAGTLRTGPHDRGNLSVSCMRHWRLRRRCWCRWLLHRWLIIDHLNSYFGQVRSIEPIDLIRRSCDHSTDNRG